MLFVIALSFGDACPFSVIFATMLFFRHVKVVCEFINDELGRVEGARLCELLLLSPILASESLRSFKLVLYFRWPFNDENESLFGIVFATELVDFALSSVLLFPDMPETDAVLRSAKLRLAIDDLLSYSFPSNCFRRSSVEHSLRSCAVSVGRLLLRV